MKVLIIYDITEDNLRNRVAEYLKAQGFIRVQKSAFIGDTTREGLKHIRYKLERMIRNHRANIQFYPLCPQCHHRRIEIGVPTVDDTYRKPIKKRGIILV